MVMPRPERGQADHRQRPAASRATAARSRWRRRSAATNRIGRRGVNRSETRPPTIRPTDSAAVIAPQAAGPPRCALRHHRTEDLEPSVPGHEDHAELGHDRPQPGVRAELGPALAQLAEHARRSVHPDVAGGAGCQQQRDGAQHARRRRRAAPSPGPNTATHSPASTAPAIWPPFMASRLIALASCSISPGHQPRQQRLRGRVEDAPCRCRSPSPAAIICHSRGWPVRTRRPKVPSPSGDHHVGGDDDQLRRDPVGDDPADEREDQRRRDLRGQHVRQVGGRPGRVEHRERDADQREREAAGASRRSASSSRKLRFASTGKRRISARVNMTEHPILTDGVGAASRC